MNDYVIKEVPLPQVWDMRRRIMYPDQSVESMKLPDDAEGSHQGLWINETPVSIVSLFKRGTEWQFRKFATETALQGQGLGTILLQHVLDEAEAGDVVRIWCNARVNAAPFYERFGFSCTGEPWQKHGIDFIKMEKIIR